MTNNAFLYLLNITHGFLIIIFIARLMFELLRAPIQNPISVFVLKTTQKLITPLQIFLPTIKRFNIATLAIILLLNVANTYLNNWLLVGGADLQLLLVILVTIIKTIPTQTLDLFFWCMIVRVVFSWLPNASFHPLAQIATFITAPILRPIQKIIPTASGLDFSPIIVLIAIGFLQRLLS